ncbi:nucleotidyltransferase family protein [Inhella gelatinilytica]|uniref:Nucleotidyltransferase family protein n=1 Tax=Inhella gelatinilytica TaxID=2795030 RepID=A0A931ND79_9BURK|nr:nucleotidyltransferase family protein [Inhella gelatinilytica]MBH9552319.1 nucleotidyltransferase family protein [Inhella gelatinilytica]
MTPHRFLQDIQRNRFNRALLAALPTLELQDAWLVAGCLFQTVWNLQSNRDPEADIKDYDLFYFDASDLSAEAEAAVQSRVQGALGHLGVPIEAKNQARVHCWYEAWCGHPYEALTCSEDGIARFLVPCTCVGVQSQTDGTLRLAAPYGLDDLYAGRLRPNPLIDHRALFRAKAASYQARWAWLQVLEGEAAAIST